MSAQHTPGPSLLLEWSPVPQTLPPGAEGHWFSPLVWLALSDGRVVHGNCLHASKGSKYKGPHDWFVGDASIGCWPGLKVVAWMPFATPEFPAHFARRRAGLIEGSSVRLTSRKATESAS